MQGGVILKQRALIFGLFLVSLLVLQKSGILDALMMFILVGAIPGTSWNIPAGSMLTLIALPTIFFSLRFISTTISEERELRRQTEKYLARKERLPKKRFRQITN